MMEWGEDVDEFNVVVVVLWVIIKLWVEMWLVEEVVFEWLEEVVEVMNVEMWEGVVSKFWGGVRFDE